jgi:ATP-dependent Lhr-like helicase
VVGATPIALLVGENAGVWRWLRGQGASPSPSPVPSLSDDAGRVLAHLQSRGASFARELATACRLDDDELRHALGELVAAGLVSCDGFAGLRAIIGAGTSDRSARAGRAAAAGRWFALRDEAPEMAREAAVESAAWTLLRRWGIVVRRLLERESIGVPWRDLARVYRRLEARGDIRGGRFVAGMSGEQFALPDAVDRLREIRRSGADDRLLAISGADPLNLTGIVTPGERIRAASGTRLVYRNGVPVAVREGDMLRILADVDPSIAPDVAAAAAGRRVSVLSGFVGRVG